MNRIWSKWRFHAHRWLEVRGALSAVNRFAAAIVGGYMFAYGFVVAFTLAGFRAGLSFDDAQGLAFLLGFLLYLAALLWAFTPRSSLHVWLMLAGSGVAMSAAAWVISRMVI